jgi:hypothetical protein
VLVVVPSHIGVAVETERDAVVERILSACFFRQDVMKLDLQAHVPMTQRTVPSARDK